MLANNLYQKVTDQIVAELEKGVVPWAQPWEGVPMFPANAVTGRHYSGINTLILWLRARQHGYASQGWMTFKQANDIGASVRKGEKATAVAFVKFREGEDNEKKTPVLRTFWVFNVSQLSNVPAAYQPQAQEPRAHDEKYERALRFTENCGVKITYGASRCCYIPSTDEIQMVDYGRFKTDDDWAGVVLHELVHATGHKTRLNREYGRRFGDAKYAFEELVAEIGSAFLATELGFQPVHRSAAYVDSWLKVLKDDKRAIFSAASYASHAADYLTQSAEHAVNVDTPEIERGLEAAE